MPVKQALATIEESGAPIVSIAGGEPLVHPQIDVLVKRKSVYLRTNTVLLRKRFDRSNFRRSPYFSFAVHVDGLREGQDASVSKEGCSTRRSR